MLILVAVFGTLYWKKRKEKQVNKLLTNQQIDVKSDANIKAQPIPQHIEIIEANLYSDQHEKQGLVADYNMDPKSSAREDVTINESDTSLKDVEK